ncbi:3-oxoacyl-ACP synthase III family protein [Clostridium sp. MSJ-4]|uniref:3-oxoacyl-ACP synthase III family protein n=1 Tax=Clostridium simiarum TaxID=2841506 RepID=A0ABS6F1V0_9CLOT|nr:3-oxoacyl-ACP synthase III family protein [Clostridium simiarum]MBU5592256.1 3-oxoacyl-ACP synthase III family protein [Clostridium simiarum]
MLKEIVPAGIIGVGAYIPEEIRKNSFWENIELVNLPVGRKSPFDRIDERRVFPVDIMPSDAETQAAEIAIEDAAISKDEIDLIMVHSMLQDQIIPSNASLVQHKLGLKNAGAWHIDTCCSSFITMLTTASNLIAMGEFKNILIVTSVFHSKLVDYSDYLSVYAGDGAGAIVMGPVPEGRGYVASCCNSDGYYHDAFTLAERMPLNQKSRRHFEPSPMRPFLTTNPVKTNGVGKNSVNIMQELLEKLLKKASMTSNDIHMFLSHQPADWAHDAWRDSINIPKERSYQTFRKHGNLASSSIPVNLYEAKKKGLLKEGENLLIASSGAGENHIAAIIKW